MTGTLIRNSAHPRLSRYRTATRAAGLIAAFVALTLCPQWARAQVPPQITRHVIGGGSRSTGGTLVVAGSIGQADTGPTLAGEPLRVTGGFWAGAASRTKGDFNDDGSLDLLLRHRTTSQLEAWIMQGVQRVRRDAVQPQPDTEWDLGGADDFGGDEQTDIVFRNAVTGAVQFWLLDGSVRTGAPVPLGNAVPLPLDWQIAATADFDRNGWADLLWRNTATQQLVVWKLDQTTRLGALIPNPDRAVDGNWQVVAALDYNGDAYVDLLWYNVSSGKIVVWFMDANVSRLAGRFTDPPSAADANWKVVAGGDFGTGSPGQPVGANDIVWQNDNSANIVAWYMDFAATRTSGTFTSPPNPDSLDWRVVGPR